MKQSKIHKESHTSPDKIGHGDYYGTGIRNKVGRIIEWEAVKQPPISSKTKPPKSLA